MNILVSCLNECGTRDIVIVMGYLNGKVGIITDGKLW